ITSFNSVSVIRREPLWATAAGQARVMREKRGVPNQPQFSDQCGYNCAVRYFRSSRPEHKQHEIKTDSNCVWRLPRFAHHALLSRGSKRAIRQEISKTSAGRSRANADA